MGVEPGNWNVDSSGNIHTTISGDKMHLFVSGKGRERNTVTLSISGDESAVLGSHFMNASQDADLTQKGGVNNPKRKGKK